MNSNALFQLDTIGEVLVITPLADLSEMDFTAMEAQGQKILERWDKCACQNVVLDLGRIGYFGSSALGLFVKIWKRVCQRHGKLAICGVSANEQDVLSITKLDNVWPIAASRDDALAMVEGKLGS